MPFYYGFDSTYLIFVLPAILISLFAQIKVQSAFNKYSKVRTLSGITGAQAALKVLETSGITGVKIEAVSGNLTDHYDLTKNVIRLSESVYASDSIAAIGVAAHEAGHAVQYAENYAPIKFRAAIIPITRFGSMLSWPLFLMGMLFNFSALMYVGIAFFAFALLFQLITLPVEFNASKRALQTIKDTYMLREGAECNGAKSVLSAAALTYVAAMITSLLHLLRLIVISNRRR